MFIYIYSCIYLCILFIYLSFTLTLFSLSLSLYLPLYLSLSLSSSVSICPSIYLSIFLYIFLVSLSLQLSSFLSPLVSRPSFSSRFLLMSQSQVSCFLSRYCFIYLFLSRLSSLSFLSADFIEFWEYYPHFTLANSPGSLPLTQVGMWAVGVRSASSSMLPKALVSAEDMLPRGAEQSFSLHQSLDLKR